MSAVAEERGAGAAPRRSDAARAALIFFDVELAEMSGEAATQYEVLLHSAMVGWEPEAADALVADHGGWHSPWVES